MLTFKKPEHWDDVLNYTRGQLKPSKKMVQSILDEVVENIKFNNCMQNNNVDHEILRTVPFVIRASDFNENNTREQAFKGNQENNIFNYRLNSGIEIFEKNRFISKYYSFDIGWNRFAVKLHKTNFITFTFNNDNGIGHRIDIKILNYSGKVEVYENGNCVSSTFNNETNRIQADMISGKDVSLKIECTDGTVDIDEINFY